MNHYNNIAIYIITCSLFLASSMLILDSKIDYSYPVVKILSIIGFEDVNKDNTFIVDNYNIVVNNFCSGLFSIGLYLAIIFSPITKSKYKISLAFYGSLFLYIINILRIISILTLSIYINPEILHYIGWSLMSLTIFTIWYYFGN